MRCMNLKMFSCCTLICSPMRVPRRLQRVLERGDGGLALVERDEHDHREHAVGDRLADVVDVGVLLGDGGRDLGEQPVAVGAEGRDDDRCAHGTSLERGWAGAGGEYTRPRFRCPPPPAPQTPRRLPPPAASTASTATLSRRAAIGWPHPRWFTLPLGALSLSANYGILWYVLCVLPWLLGESRPLVKALYVAVPVTLVEMTGFVIKHFVARPRPPVADPTSREQIPLPLSKSFPSSHASMAVVGRSRWGRCTQRRSRARRSHPCPVLQPGVPRRALPRRCARRPRVRAALGRPLGPPPPGAGVTCTR